MSFQKCPICNGTGNDPFIVGGQFTSYPCPTCKGARIISELTGEPPITQEQHNVFESLISMRHTITPTQTPTQDVSHIQTRESQVREPGS